MTMTMTMTMSMTMSYGMRVAGYELKPEELRKWGILRSGDG